MSTISINNVAAIATILPALATLQTAARVGHRKDSLVFWRPESESVLDLSGMNAIKALVEAGHAVKLFEGKRVLTPYLNAAGEVQWNERTAKRDWSSPVVTVRMTRTPVALVVDDEADVQEAA